MNVMEKFVDVRMEPGFESILLRGWPETARQEIHPDKNCTKFLLRNLGLGGGLEQGH